MTTTTGTAAAVAGRVEALRKIEAAAAEEEPTHSKRELFSDSISP